MKESAEELRRKRERQTHEIKSPSKIKQNLKVQNKLRHKSATIKAKLAARMSMESPKHEEGVEEGINNLIGDLNVTYEQLAKLPRQVEPSPERTR